MESTAPKTQTLAQCTVTVVFLAFIGYGLIGHTFRASVLPPIQHRSTVASPLEISEKGYDGVQQFIDRTQEWSGRHFGGVDDLTRINSTVKFSVFRSAPYRTVYFSDELLFSDLRGVHPNAAEHAARWYAEITRRAEFFRELGVPYRFVITPDKHTIYPDRAPVWMRVNPDQSILDQLTALDAQSQTPLLIDLREPLQSLKPPTLAYLDYDTHFNYHGYAASTEAIMSRLREDAPDLSLHLRHAHRIDRVIDYDSDLARGSNLEHYLLEPLSLVAPNDRYLKQTIRSGPRGFSEHRYTDRGAASGETPRPRLHAYGDSFLMTRIGLHMHLHQYFKSSLFQRRRHGELDITLDPNNLPDVVINTMVEQNLRLDPPKAKITLKADLD